MGGWMGAALVVAVALSSLEHHQNGCLVGGASAFAIAAVVHSPMSYSSSEKEGMDGRTTRTHPGSSFLAAPTVAAFRRRGGGGTEAASRSSSARLRLSSSSAGSATAAAVSRENLALLSERGRAAVERLVHWDATTSSMNGAPSQTHVYGDWPLPGTDDDGKRQLAEQVRPF